ncbi:YaiI/YqxD family protein [Serpentinicella sp. ANB-PHB4]|uniref:YaiI/YqxD family protein n=1 Tax=Serpentinicella sp. ANB-PHB4 TaxID=3074076 RepID=UPI0028677470|nr:YaiI/YqxD family protein [Serpentinicella sp. ANB-PHB4]MDR5658816.1 YaiI/YqxD family protein [Serpentinicella sp. ANB-PHB4]
MRILVDADGCPVKDIILDVAKQHKIEVIMVKNICHELNDDYAKIITVDQGRDMADLVLINNAKKGDIIVTQDYGVAALALGKDAYAIHQNGWEYTKENIDGLLMKRHINQQMRMKQKKYSKIPKRSKEDNRLFEEGLKKLLKEIMAIEKTNLK